MNSKIKEILEFCKEGIKKLPHAVYRLMFPDLGLCYVCGCEGPVVCEKCSADMKRHSGNLCTKCGRSVKEAGLCRQCMQFERPYEEGIIALFYEGKAQQAMKEYKFENMLPYSKFFANEIFEKIKTRGWKVDIVTAVPSHPLKVMGKAYNPPALIAKKLAAMIGAEYSGRLLKRTRYTRSMSLLHGIDRMEHSKKNFDAGRKEFANKNILLIDDVSTTGATLHVCSEILKKHNANKVYIAAACGDTSGDGYGETTQGVV